VTFDHAPFPVVDVSIEYAVIVPPLRYVGAAHVTVRVPGPGVTTMFVGAVEGVVAKAGEIGNRSAETTRPKRLINLSTLVDIL